MAQEKKEEKQMKIPNKMTIVDEVKAAYLQAAVSLPKLLNAESTINKDKTKGLQKMYLTAAPDGLLLIMDNGKAWIGEANVKGVSLVD